MKDEKFIKQLQERELVDERNLYMIVNIKIAPNGEYGMSLFTLKGAQILISDINSMATKVGNLMYTIDVADIRDFKYKFSRLNGFIRFRTPMGEFMTLGVDEPFVNGLLESLTEENLAESNKVTLKDKHDRAKQPAYVIAAVVIVVAIRTFLRML